MFFSPLWCENNIKQMLSHYFGANQRIESKNRLKESNQRIQSMNRLKESNQRIESMNRIKESNQRIELETYYRHNGHNRRVQ